MTPKKARKLTYTDHIVLWTMAGLQCGYPACCVGEFVIRCIKNSFADRPKRKFYGTGFVPCCSCEEKKTERKLLDHIAANRDPNFPAFPNAPWENTAKVS